MQSNITQIDLKKIKSYKTKKLINALKKITDEQINILISQEFQALMLLRDNPNNKYIFREEN